MMGAHHAACGAAAWVATTTAFTVPLDFVREGASAQIGLGLMDLSPTGVITGALVCAGAAMLPDADHHNATIAHSLPPLSNAMCKGIGKVSGGHRHGTHSIIGIAVFTALAWAAGLWTMSWGPFAEINVGAGLLSVLLVAFAAKALKIIPDRLRKSPWAVGLALGAVVAFFPPEHIHWFAIAVGIGVIVHILGDMMTTGGCNLVWPAAIKPPKWFTKIPVLKSCWHKNGYVALPVLGNAGSTREWLLLIPISVYALIGVGSTFIGLGQDGLSQLLSLAG